MTNEPPLSDISETVGAQVRRWRTAQRMTVEEVATLCAGAGAPQLTVASLYALESGRKEKATGRRRRLVTVDELLALARALRVKPISLLVPPDLGDDEPYSITPGVTTTAGEVRMWLRGELVPPGVGAADRLIEHDLARMTDHQDPDAVGRMMRRAVEANPDEWRALFRRLDDLQEGDDHAGDPQGRPR